MHVQLKRVRSFYSTYNLSAIEKNFISVKGFYQFAYKIYCYKCGESYGIGRNSMDEVDKHECTAGILNLTPSVPIPSPYTSAGLNNAKNDLNFEEFRYATFSNWTMRSILETEPPELASAGFYYSNSPDTLKCFYCKTILYPMISPNRTISEHKKNQICRQKKFSLQVQVNSFKRSKSISELPVDKRTKRRSVDQADGATMFILLKSSTFNKEVTTDNVEEIVSQYMAMQIERETAARNELVGREMECKICMDEKVGIIFKPCHHAVACRGCSEKVTACPVCCTTIEECSKIYF